MQIGVEAQCRENRNVRSHLTTRVDRGPHFRQIAHRFDDDAVHTTVDEALDLLGEELLSRFGGQRSHRFQQFARWPHIPQDENTLVGVGDAARDLRSRLVQFVDAVVEAVHEKPRLIPPEGIRGE